jgi:prepilin-type N-terminal cleavage/methylation domain-containing protein
MTHVRDWNLGRSGWAAGSARGFTLVEMLVVVAIAGIAMTFALAGIGSAKASYRARGAVARLKEVLTTGREMAVSQQRSVKLEFKAPDRIVLTRVENPTGETVVRDVRLEGGMEFVRFPVLDPTPDAWGGDKAVAFSDAANLVFRSDGALVNENNDYVNGRVFVGSGTDRTTAGFVSIFGATGRVRSYRVEGTAWVH